MNANLAMPRDERAQNFLTNDIGYPNSVFWVGVSYDAEERRWMFDDKSTFTGQYSAWNVGQNGDMSGKNCVYSSNTAGEVGWNRANCMELKNFVCQKDPEIKCIPMTNS